MQFIWIVLVQTTYLVTSNNEPMAKFNYYDNSHVCGECNGQGCRQCIGGLSGFGRTRFPLSRMINGCQPPAIQNQHAAKLHPLTALYCLMNRPR